MRTILDIVFALAFAVLVAVFPASASAGDGEWLPEALFLPDSLPPGAPALDASLRLAPGEPAPSTGGAGYAASPRLQLGIPFADGRLGITVGVGFSAAGAVTEPPGAALKLLLRSAEGGRTGFAASFELFGATHSRDAPEVGAGLNALRAIGPVTVRAAAGFASATRWWTPHFHGGVSGAFAPGDGWCVLGEVLAELSGGEGVLSAGPSVRVTLDQRTSILAGALFQVAPAAAAPVALFQLTRTR